VVRAPVEPAASAAPVPRVPAATVTVVRVRPARVPVAPVVTPTVLARVPPMAVPVPVARVLVVPVLAARGPAR
jgi:hypothetical protein